jgi:sugar phosphate isomerase/epimerase
LILSAGTLRGVPVAVRASAAEAAGFDAIAVHHDDLGLGPPESGGFPVAEIGFLHRWATPEAMAEREPLLDLAARLGARRLTAGVFEADDQARLADAFAGLCAAAAAGALQVDLEPFPFGALPDPGAALALITASGAANARLLLDAWHFHRAGAPWHQLEALPAGLVGSLHLSDAAALPAADVSEESRHARLLPGRGVIAFDRLLETLERTGQAPAVAVEVLSDQLDVEPPQRRAELAFAAAASLLAAAGWSRAERS